jgi:hypothetical protein
VPESSFIRIPTQRSVVLFEPKHFYVLSQVHNIVLYPDKHSWCNTTPIKQVVAFPGCSSVEIDNNVCVGACFSYSIPRTAPSAPGELIKPYCDSCQPSTVAWHHVRRNLGLCPTAVGSHVADTEYITLLEVLDLTNRYFMLCLNYLVGRIGFLNVRKVSRYLTKMTPMWHHTMSFSYSLNLRFLSFSFHPPQPIIRSL